MGGFWPSDVITMMGARSPLSSAAWKRVPRRGAPLLRHDARDGPAMFSAQG
jgi:hypothetical protein